MLPLVLSRVTSFVFHGSATPNPRAILGHVSEFDSGPKINAIVLICLAIPAVMTVRSIFSVPATPTTWRGSATKL